jgi:SAM-dependent methyltransferase
MLEEEYHILAAVEHRHWWYRTLHRRVLDQLSREARRLGRPLRVFDAGCGTGGLLLRLREQPFLSVGEGCELNPVALAHARSRGLPVEPLSVNLLESWPHQYDVVLSMDVLYHRDVDPVEALRGMRRLLNPGGLLLVNVAAMPCLRRGHDERVMGARRFLPRDLRRLVQQSGVAVESIRYWNGWLTPLLWLQLQLEMLRSPGRSEPAEKKPNESEIRLPPPWLNRMLEALLQAEFLCSEVLPLPFGSSLFMKGRREDNGVEP